MSEAAAALEDVEVRQDGAVGIVQLNRPSKSNAMRQQGIAAIAAAMDEFEASGSGVRAVLLLAGGRNFCTGGDLHEAGRMSADPAVLEEFLDAVAATLSRLETSELPVVAACQGLVLAGGLEIAACCDVVLAADDARFGDQHVQYGLVPAWGGTVRLPRVIGEARALDLMLSGRWIDAATAQAWGLVAQIFPAETLRESALDYCRALADRSPAGVSAMKRLVRDTSRLPESTALENERASVLDVMGKADSAEGLAAFHEHRDPRFDLVTRPMRPESASEVGTDE